MTDFYKSSFGDLQLWISRLSTTGGRTQVVHDLSIGDDYVVEDKGAALVKARATVMFDWMRDDDLAPIDRARRLLATVDAKPRFFRHPLAGTFLARVGPFEYEINEHGVISADVEFTQITDILAIADAAGSGIPASGEGAVSEAAEALNLELESIGITSTLPADAATAADSWAASEDLNPRDVLTQTGSLTEQLGTQAGELEDDIDAWEAFKTTVLLAEAVRSAAEAATADTAQTFVIKIGTSVALRALLAANYGADEVDLRYTQAMQLNDIANPASLELGQELILPQPTPKRRSA